MNKIQQLKELLTLVSDEPTKIHNKTSLIQDGFIGKKVIVRTYSAGVWFGTVAEKEGNEIILSNARRMWKWWAAQSISLSGVAQHGIKQSESKICPAVSSVWLQPIEILSLTEICIETIESAPDASQ